MSGGNHLVIDEFFRSAQVTAQAACGCGPTTSRISIMPSFAFCSDDSILPALDRVRPQPARSRTMAALATHSVVQFKGLGALLG